MIVHENNDYQILINQIEEMSHNLNDIASFENALNELEIIAKREKDSILQAVVLYHKSDVPYMMGDYELSKHFVIQAMQLCKEINLTYYVMRCYNALAVVDSQNADFHSSITNYIKAFHIADLHPDYKYSCILLNNIGNLFVWLDEHKIALEYLIKSYNKYYDEKMDFIYVLSLIVLNIVEEYSLLGKYDMAIKWASKDIPFVKEATDGIETILNTNKIDIYYQNKDFVAATALADRTIETADEKGCLIYVFRSYLRLLKFAISAKDTETINKVLKRTELLSNDPQISMFLYEYELIKYDYYKTFLEDNDNDGAYAKAILKSYVQHSEHTVAELKNNYTRRLLIETELFEVTTEKEKAINESKKLLKDIELDYFTKILNKISLEKYINESIQGKTDNTLQAMLLIDIDYFKNINDTYGHDNGDKLILKVVDMISSCCNKNMLFGRFGGDEFIVFIKKGTQVEYFEKFAKKLIRKAHSIRISNESTITLSIGMRIFSKKIEFNELFNLADFALYEAKKEGRDRYLSFFE